METVNDRDGVGLIYLMGQVEKNGKICDFERFSLDEYEKKNDEQQP